MKEDFPPSRHSSNLAFNPNFEQEDRICGYEHCIENMPFTDQGIDCPVFGHDCPGGISQVETCRKKKGRLRSVPLSKAQKLKPQFFPLRSTQSSKTGFKIEHRSFEEILNSHLSKLIVIKIQLGLLCNEKNFEVSEIQGALKGCHEILDEFLKEVRGLLSDNKEK